MNNIGETIDMKKASCREMYLPDLMSVLKSDIMKFWSWGVNTHTLTVDNRKTPRAFRMTVSGHHHKGYVYIFLNGLDLFDVYLTTKKDVIIKRTEEMGIYADQLVDWIDEKVERIPEYER